MKPTGSYVHRIAERPVLAVLSCAALLAFVALAASPSGLGTAPADARSKARGTLKVKIGGLPKGTRGLVTIKGPGKYKRKIRKSGKLKLRKVRAGVYRLRVRQVRVRRASGSIRKGAFAYPVKSRLKVRVKRGRKKTAKVRYGSILNPGVKRVSSADFAVLGNPENPTALVFQGDRRFGKVIVTGKPPVDKVPGNRLPRRKRFNKYTVLSAAPDEKIPHGLLAQVVSSAYVNGVTIVGLTPANIYDVAPNMHFSKPIGSPSIARQAIAGCEGSTELTPSADISNTRLEGSWTTSKVLFTKVRTGARLNLRFKVSAGLGVTSTTTFGCSLPLPVFALQGLIGPVPVYGAIKPSANVIASVTTRLRAGGSVKVRLGTKIGAIPPKAKANMSFSSPKFNFDAELFGSLVGVIGLDAEVGLGVASAADIHLKFANNLKFTAGLDGCQWDLNLGSFSAVGELGPATIETPSTSPLLTRNLWKGCNDGDAPIDDLPPPVPPVRANMGWNSDSDIDLYIWDQAGNLAYYDRLDGIPDAELVQDIIPVGGQDVHPAEEFRETANPGRTFTFGICLYDGNRGDTILKVSDPNGAVRVYRGQLSGIGDHQIITSSPEGQQYVPDPGWCRHV